MGNPGYAALLCFLGPAAFLLQWKSLSDSRQGPPPAPPQAPIHAPIHVDAESTEGANIALPLSDIIADWREAYGRCDLLWTNEEHKVQYRPEVGNGFIATVVGSDKLYAAGVYNGKALDPSHRAEITSPLDLHLNGEVVAAALDLRNGVYIRRYLIQGNVIDLRFYAHRARRSLLVAEVDVVRSQSQEPVNVELIRGWNSPNETDFSWRTSQQTTGGTSTTVWEGSTHKAELPSSSTTSVAVVFATKSESSVLTLTPGSPETIVAVVRTSLESASPAAAAMQDWATVHAMKGKDLFAEHSAAWAVLWKSGMEIEGRLDVARAVNSSLYYILSSVREDTVHSLSPGGLAGNGYNGHVFWDCETWMYPTMVFWHPKIAESLLKYRVNRVDEAKQKASSYKKGYKGAMFPWESAATGAETCPTWALMGQLEQHISGDIAFAAQQYWYATQDIDWLHEVYPHLLQQTAEFWVSRVSLEKGVAHIRGVIPPDEYRLGRRKKGVDDSVYTNFVAQRNLIFSAEAGELLGEARDLCEKWLRLADAIPILFDKHRGIHPEHEGYKGAKIKQADVVLLAFPLMMNMSAKVRKADLEYYAPITDEKGPAMTWAMHAVGFMEVGDPAQTAVNFNRSFANAQSPFLVWSETPTGGAVNFITGAGGFLQGALFGLAGLRIWKTYLAVNPVLVEGMTSVVARGIHYRGTIFDLSFNQESMIFTSVSGPSFSVVNDGVQVVVTKRQQIRLPRGYAEVQVTNARVSAVVM